MGLYINPPNMSKEQFLTVFGTPCGIDDFCNAPEGKTGVCLVDNGRFTAAGVAYSKGEAEAFARADGRYKRFYLVPTHRLSVNAGISDQAQRDFGLVS